MIIINLLCVSNLLLVYGLLFFLVSISFFLIKCSLGLTIGILINFDLVRFGLCMLVFIVFLVIVLVGVFEYYRDNKITMLMIVIFFIIIGLLLVFSISSFFLFYVFFEFIVIPIFLIVLIWGYRIDRIQAALYIFIYTLIRSLPLIIGLLFLFNYNVSFFFNYTYYLFNLNNVYNYVWWILFIVVFMVKLPIFFYIFDFLKLM